jgi:hypothetical protein
MAIMVQPYTLPFQSINNTADCNTVYGINLLVIHIANKILFMSYVMCWTLYLHYISTIEVHHTYIYIYTTTTYVYVYTTIKQFFLPLLLGLLFKMSYKLFGHMTWLYNIKCFLIHVIISLSTFIQSTSISTTASHHTMI